MGNHVRHCPGCNGYTASWDVCEGLSKPELAAILEAKLMMYARCNFDGRPMHPEDARVVEAFTETLRARAGGARPGLRWRERRQDAYWQEWYCEPPQPRDLFRVTHEEWAEENGQPVRRIYAIEEIHGAASSPAGTDSDGPAGPGTASPAGGGRGSDRAAGGRPAVPEAPAAPAQGG